MTQQWYLNTTWDESIELAFEAKLRRARNKSQYLRMQGGFLASSFPEVSLRLLDRYFQLHDDFDDAMAHVHRAEAFLALGNLHEATKSYEAALAREAEFPRLLTEAYIEFPLLIATEKIEMEYGRALELLEQHRGRLLFPVDHFRWHAAHALLATYMNKRETANIHANLALEFAACDHSGFRNHPSVGLVSAAYEQLIARLEALAEA